MAAHAGQLQDLRAHGAGGGVHALEVLDHAVRETGLHKAHAEDAFVLKDGRKRLLGVLVMAEGHAREAALHLVQTRVGRNGHFAAVVVHAHQVAQPAGLDQRDALQVGNVHALFQIRLDRLAEADGQLLGSVGGDALGRVGQEAVGQAHGEHLA